MNKPNRNFKQKGNMLLLIMLSLLFLGGLALSTTDLIGSKQREATSKLPEASLEAAIYASYNYIKSTARNEFNKIENLKTELEACEAIYQILNPEQNKTAIYLDNQNLNQKISWKFNIEKSCSNLNKPIKINIKSWQGNESSPISTQLVTTYMNFKKDVIEANEVVSNLLGDKAVTAVNSITLKGTNKQKASITGSIETKNLNLNSNSELKNVEDENYSNTISYDESTSIISGNVSNNLQYTTSTTIVDDPIGLNKEIENIHCKISNNNKKYVNDLKSNSSISSIYFLILPLPTNHIVYPNKYLRGLNSEKNISNYEDRTNKGEINFCEPTMFYKQEVSMGFTKNLRILSSSDLTIKGGDVYLYVDGDLTMNASATVNIDDDSTLTLIVRGQTFIYDGILYRFFKFNKNNKPSFNILSTNKVTIHKNARHEGFIYSLGDLKLDNNAVIEGQVFAKNITLEAGSRIEYKSADIEDYEKPEESQPEIITFTPNFNYGLEF